MDSAKTEHEAEIGILKRKLNDTNKRADELEEERNKGLPVDAAAEIKKFKEKLVCKRSRTGEKSRVERERERDVGRRV